MGDGGTLVGDNGEVVYAGGISVWGTRPLYTCASRD